MATNFTKPHPENTRVDFANGTGSAIAAGDLVQVGTLWGVAITDIAVNAIGSVETAGRVELTKPAATAIAQGQTLFKNAASDQVSVTPTAGPVLGRASEAAAASATHVEVDLNVINRLDIAHVVSSAQGTANVAVLDLGTGRDPFSVNLQILNTADPKAARIVTTIDFNGDGTISIAHASLAENEIISGYALA
jgi:predicted RecA/RadA family phage recombinase